MRYFVFDIGVEVIRENKQFEEKIDQYFHIF